MCPFETFLSLNFLADILQKSTSVVSVRVSPLHNNNNNNNNNNTLTQKKL